MQKAQTIGIVCALVVAGMAWLSRGGETLVAAPASDAERTAVALPMNEPVRVHFRRADDVQVAELPAVAKLSYFDGRITATDDRWLTLEMEQTGTRWVPIDSIAYICLMPQAKTKASDNEAAAE